ncbi:MAG: histidine--tRNA ligase [Bacteroidetes bacterium]|nr:MAG: histidine--tRNA ligase [Bacteroidota bacterium]
MAIQKPSLPKGTRDFGAAEVQKRKYILNTIETVFKKYGFMPLETPTMENLSTLEGKYGDEGDKLLFRILNSGDAFKDIKEKNGEQKVSDTDFRISAISEKGLRYDLTVPFARYVVMNRNNITFPFKRYQMQPVWRADRPQKGRYREFWQCDADVVGSDSLLNELDLIQIYDEAFNQLGIGYELRMNNRKVLAGIAQVVKSIDVMSTIAVAIDKLDKIGEEGVRKELQEQGFSADELNTLFDIISIRGENEQILQQLKPKIKTTEEGLKGIEELELICQHLKTINASIRLKLDFSLARGLSYYTGCIFEVVATEGTLKSSIGGGGRYDNLTGIFGLPNVSGVGISFGLDRIYDVLDELKLFPPQLRASSTGVLFCHLDAATQQYCLPALKQLRDAGIAAEVYPDVVVKKDIGKIKGVQFDYASALGIPFTAFAGEQEMAQGVFQVKSLATGAQQVCTIEQLITLYQQQQ